MRNTAVTQDPLDVSPRLCKRKDRPAGSDILKKLGRHPRFPSGAIQEQEDVSSDHLLQGAGIGYLSRECDDAVEPALLYQLIKAGQRAAPCRPINRNLSVRPFGISPGPIARMASSNGPGSRSE